MTPLGKMFYIFVAPPHFCKVFTFLQSFSLRSKIFIQSQMHGLPVYYQAKTEHFLFFSIQIVQTTS